MFREEESESEDDDISDDGETDSDSQEPPQLVPVASKTDAKDANKRQKPVEESAGISKEEEDERDSDRKGCVLVEVDERPREQWDCETILR